MTVARSNPTGSADDGREAVGPALGQLLGWAALAAIDAVYIAAVVPSPGLEARVGHHLYDAGHLLGAGLFASALVAAWQRFLPRQRVLGYLAIAALAAAVAVPFLVPDLTGAAGKLVGDDAAPPWVLVAMVAVVATGIAAAALVGRWLSRRGWLAAVGVGLGLAAAAANLVVLPADYFGVHLFVAIGSATLVGASLSGLPVPGRVARHRRGQLGLAARALLAAACAFTLVVSPPPAVAVEMFRVSGAVVAPILARLPLDADPEGLGDLDRGDWFQPRSTDAPPTGPAFVTSPIIVLVCVDALRAEVVNDDAHAHVAPALHRLRAESVAFSNARSMSSSTLSSVTGMFASRYYSALFWGEAESEKTYLYPVDDPSPRFTEILVQHGFDTAMFSGLRGLDPELGPTRGVREVKLMRKGRRGAPAADLVDAIVARIRRQKADTPLFIYTHFIEPHAPYDSAGKRGEPYERYLREVTLADRAIAQLREALAAPEIAPRAVLILTADHGEAFGEHGAYSHGTHLYEEHIRVPLLIAAPGAAPRQIDQAVTLADIGPTLLDLVGLPAPASFLGQSLVPFLRGDDPALTRPVAFESQRLIRAMIFDDGLKLIHDRRRNTTELYDLARDPGERHNLFGLEHRERFEQMRAFFAAHEARREGYSAPYQR